MPHMVAQEHMGYVDALRYGTARTNVTLAAALSAIGSSLATLIVTFAGDGVWTISSNLTIPANVTLYIPPGVTVNRGVGVTLTVNGPIIAFQSTWETGAGVTVRNTSTATEISSLISTNVRAQAPLGSSGFTLSTPGLIPQIQMFNQGSPNASPGMSFVLDPAVATSNWVLGNNPNLNAVFFISHINDNPHFALSNIGCWIGNGTVTVPAPLHLLHLQLDDAFKPATSVWTTTSDARLKTVIGPYIDGLAMLRALPDPVIYTLNGKAETPADGKEYVGMLGQDVQPVAPYMISTYPGKLEPTDTEPTDIITMNNSAMTYALINAVRELAARVEALETAATARTTASHAPPHAAAPPAARRKKAARGKPAAPAAEEN